MCNYKIYFHWAGKVNFKVTQASTAEEAVLSFKRMMENSYAYTILEDNHFSVIDCRAC